MDKGNLRSRKASLFHEAKLSFFSLFWFFCETQGSLEVRASIFSSLITVLVSPSASPSLEIIGKNFSL